MGMCLKQIYTLKMTKRSRYRDDVLGGLVALTKAVHFRCGFVMVRACIVDPDV